MSLRVLHVIESLGRGGAETTLLALVPAMREAGVEVDVAALAPPNDLQPELEAAGARVHRVGVGRSWSVHRGAVRLGRLLRTGRYDVAHSHLFHATLHLAASCVVAPGVRRTTTFHNLAYLSHPPRTRAKRAHRWLHGWMVRNAFEGALAVSSVVARHHEEHLGLADIEVVPNAVNTERVAAVAAGRGPGLPPWWSSDRDAFEVLVPGRLSPEKGQRFILDAVADLLERGFPVRLHVVGTGPSLPDLQAHAAALGLEDRVAFHDPVGQGVLFELFRAADVAVFPSLQEGFGLAAAEALAIGCPVVATRCGGLEEVVTDGETGLLVPPGDGHALADAVARIAERPDLGARLARNGQKTIREYCAPSAVASALRDHYQRLLDP